MSLRPRLVGSGNLNGIATSLTLLAMTLEKSLSLGVNGTSELWICCSTVS